MKHPSKTLAISVALSATMWALPAATMAQNITVTSQPPPKVKVVKAHELKNGDVAGVIENNSNVDVRNVQLLVRYTWHWNNEFQPGPESQNPGRAYFYTVRGSIPAGTFEEFSFEPPKPLTHRTDGHFETTVQIAGFTTMQELS